MSMENLLIKIWHNREEIIIRCCFWGVFCFNVLSVCLSLFNMFTYDGGISDAKTYYEIKTVVMAQRIFFQNMIESWLYGLLFSFPLVWSYFYIKHINLNAILVQLLPILTIAGMALFG